MESKGGPSYAACSMKRLVKANIIASTCSWAAACLLRPAPRSPARFRRAQRLGNPTLMVSIKVACPNGRARPAPFFQHRVKRSLAWFCPAVGSSPRTQGGWCTIRPWRVGAQVCSGRAVGAAAPWHWFSVWVLIRSLSGFPAVVGRRLTRLSNGPSKAAYLCVRRHALQAHSRFYSQP